MHTPSPGGGGGGFPDPGTDLGSLDVVVSAEANDRYWRGAGIDHPARRAGLLYPPMAVNLTILLVQRTVPGGVLHTREELRSLAAVRAPTALTVTGSVADRFEKRGRDYFVVESLVVADDGTELWSSVAALASSRRQAGGGGGGGGAGRGPGESGGGSGGPGREASRDDSGPPASPASPPLAASSETRRLTLDADLLRTYSRAGNFHSDDTAARDMGLPGMTAMGMQTAGPAYAVGLDAWGDALVERGTLEAKFFGLVLEGDTVEVAVERDGGAAEFRVVNVTRDAPTATGRLTVA